MRPGRGGGGRWRPGPPGGQPRCRTADPPHGGHRLRQPLGGQSGHQPGVGQGRPCLPGQSCELPWSQFEDSAVAPGEGQPAPCSLVHGGDQGAGVGAGQPQGRGTAGAPCDDHVRQARPPCGGRQPDAQVPVAGRAAGQPARGCGGFQQDLGEAGPRYVGPAGALGGHPGGVRTVVGPQETHPQAGHGVTCPGSSNLSVTGSRAGRGASRAAVARRRSFRYSRERILTANLPGSEEMRCATRS